VTNASDIFPFRRKKKGTGKRGGRGNEREVWSEARRKIRRSPNLKREEDFRDALRVEQRDTENLRKRGNARRKVPQNVVTLSLSLSLSLERT
jgi:hypothetical protein